MNLNDIETKIESLLAECELIRTEIYDGDAKQGFQYSYAGIALSAKYETFRDSCKNLFVNIAGQDHTIVTAINDRVTDCGVRSIENLKSILERAKKDVSEGWIGSLRGLVAAEIFVDYLDMSKHLLKEGYKDPSAVLIGSTLENHLKELCKANSIPITKNNAKGKKVSLKASALNIELTKKGVYDLLTQKQITAWLDLRNNAAHGNYSKYDRVEVRDMLNWVRRFMT